MSNAILGTSPLNESIYFDYAPVPTFAGHINRYPFRVFITSTNDKPHVITLDSEHSKSYRPQTDKNKWSFLRPEVKFLDLNLNEIDHIITKDTRLYKTSNGTITSEPLGIFIGVSGYAEFYFVDDIYNYDLAISNQKYSTIIAILQTSGIDYFDNKFTNLKTLRSTHIESTNDSNSTAIAKQPHVFLYREPDFIKVSENGIRDFINPRWPAVNQYTVFSFNWDKEYKENFYDGNDVLIYNYFYNFNKSIPSNTNKNDIPFSAAGNSIRVFFPDSLKFKYFDENRYKVPGYFKTYFNVATSSDNLAVSALVSFNSPETKGMYFNSKLWLSNPMAGQISLVEYNAPHYVFDEPFNIPTTVYPDNSPKPDILSNFLKANIYCFDMPLIKADFRINGSVSNDAFEAGNYHSIDSIAVIPSPSNQAWAIDSDLNMLYKINTDGSILSSIDLLTIYKQNSAILPPPIVENQLSPASITLDSKENLWITLYDNKYVLNLDKNGNFVYILDLTSFVTEYNIPNISSEWYDANQPIPNDDIDAQNFVEPTFLDVDSRDRIWVTYSNYASGFLSKFDQNNNLFFNIVYPLCSCPQDIIIDREDNAWVSLSNNIWNSLGKIEKRDTNGNLLSSFGPIMGVNELTLDLNQNLWFSYSYSRIGKIDGKTGQVYTFSILGDSKAPDYFSYGLSRPVEVNGSFDGYNPSTGLTIVNQNTDETLIEGIACDLRGYLYVVNSIANQIIVYDTKTNPIKLVDKFYVNPQGFNFWTQNEQGETQMSNNMWGKSLRAHGDWTGMKWINKFKNTSGTYSKTISGISVPLSFKKIPSVTLSDRYSFLATSFYKYIETSYLEKIKVTPRRDVGGDDVGFNLTFYKVNENFDLADYIKTFAITPTLYNSSFLFDTFLPSIYGYYPFSPFDLGIYSYEKISNFTLNHSDVDTCNVKNLYDLAKMVDDETNDYSLDYPSEIKRIMDVLSINPSRVLGSVAKNQNYFGITDENGQSNRGRLLTNSYSVTAGTPVILKTKSLDHYQLIQTGLVDNKFIYTLNDLSVTLNINVPWNDYYEYYEFKLIKNLGYNDNIIDWYNTQTTFTNNITSVNDWIGDEKLIDSLFSYNLYRGLNLF
jgi:hypothetical protein